MSIIFNPQAAPLSAHHPEPNEPICLSILVATFNHEKFIRQSLESFVCQITNFRVEIIVNDDASTDNTPAIIKEFENKYPDLFVVFYQKENQYSKGKKPWYNVFFPNARGKYIALCEGDDYWTDPYKLQKQVDFLETNPEYVITGHDSHCIDTFGNPTNHQYIPEKFKSDCPSDKLKKGFWIATLTMCFRNLPILKNYPKEAYYVKNGDTFLICVLGQFGSYKYMPDIQPAAYRVHAGGVWSQNNTLANALGQKNTEKKLIEYFTSVGDIDTARHFKKDILNTCNQNIFEAAWQNRKHQVFFAYFLRTFFYFIFTGRSTRAFNNLKTMIKYCFGTKPTSTPIR